MPRVRRDVIDMSDNCAFDWFAISIERRLEHITSTKNELDNLIRPFLEKRMDNYKQRFGKFERRDRDLWYNVDPARLLEQMLHEARDDLQKDSD